MIPPNSLDAILEAFRSATSFILTAHINPDGDAVGSMLALRRLLLQWGKEEIHCVLSNVAPEECQWLPDVERIVGPDVPLPSADWLIMLDASRRTRLGAVADKLHPSMPMITIDHHADDAPHGDIVLVDPSYGACGEIIAELYQQAGLVPDYEAALCLYVAIITDTGSFQFPNTSARTHRLVADLLAAGVDAGEVSGRVFHTMSRGRFTLMVRVLQRLQISGDGRIAWSEVFPGDFNETGARPEDLNNLINYGRDIDGVEVAVLFRSIDPTTTKISLRARPSFNAIPVAAYFDGGGHPGAAGATLNMSLGEARRAILTRIQDYMGETT